MIAENPDPELKTVEIPLDTTVKSAKAAVKGLPFSRYFTKVGVNPFDMIEWEKRDATITNEKGEVIFSQKNVEVPKAWSQQATNIVISKYFVGKLGTKARETSIKQLISRVANTYARWAKEASIFASEEYIQAFQDELTYILATQKMSFNSPVWFNVGVHEKPQVAACFINKVDDTMADILRLCVTEGMIFKRGSGSGVNVSNLRARGETLRLGGTSSGPVEFMKGLDTFAGVIKSGGTTRRAAKMVILNVDHPDIMAFIRCKMEEEKRAWTLIDAGYNGSFNVDHGGAALGQWGIGAYEGVFFQNANHSVRATDDFMRAVLADKDWTTNWVQSGEPAYTYKAKEVLRAIAEGTHFCGDPGMQFDTTANKWNTCPNSGRINGSNPCSEYMFLDETSCNLASVNLMECRNDKKEFDVEKYKHILRTTIIAQELSIDNASYPTPAITENSHTYRSLGIGYANLGALLMSLGLPYDGAVGRNVAAALTSILSGITYKASAEMAGILNPFDGYKENEETMLKVIDMHRSQAYAIPAEGVPKNLLEAARTCWDEAFAIGEKNGFRNAQISVLAPTGTIAFMMDCTTTGIEPDIALVKYKWLVGGGMMKMVNTTVPEALDNLSYTKDQIKEILKYIDENDTIEGAPHLKEEHLAVFDCAFKPKKGKRSISPIGHIKMMSAVQPFISGAISKTVNVPENITVEEIMDLYLQSWKLGIKSIAIYRDNSKRTQPLTMQNEKVASKKDWSIRRRLPDERQSLTHKFNIGNHEGFITVGLYNDGSPGELFINMSKQGSTINGFLDSFSIAISYALQHGTPMKNLVRKFMHIRFEPQGFTSNPNIRVARSIVDYIFRWMGMTFLSAEDREELGLQAPETRDKSTTEFKQLKLEGKTPSKSKGNEDALNEESVANAKITFQRESDAPMCHECGSMMVRSGSCYKCLNCGISSGCS